MTELYSFWYKLPIMNGMKPRLKGYCDGKNMRWEKQKKLLSKKKKKN